MKEWYAEKNRLATEHPAWTTTATAVGTEQPDAGSGEGLLAGQVTLAKPIEAVSPAGSGQTAELEALRKKKLDLETALRELRARRRRSRPIGTRNSWRPC